MRVDVLAQRHRVEAAEGEARRRIRDEEGAADDNRLVGVDDVGPGLLRADAGQQPDDVGRVGVADEPRRGDDAGVAGHGVDGGVHDGLDGATPRSGAARPVGARGDEDGAQVRLRGRRVVDDGHHLGDVDDDEVLGRGDGEPGAGGLDDETSVVEELGGVALGEDREVAGGLAEQGGQGDQPGGDQVGFPGRVGHESMARSCRSRSRASRQVKWADASSHRWVRGVGAYVVMSVVPAMTRRMSARPPSSPRATS